MNNHNGFLNRTHHIASLALIIVTFGNGGTGGRPTSEMVQYFYRKVVGQWLSIGKLGEVDLQVWQMGSFQ